MKVFTCLLLFVSLISFSQTLVSEKDQEIIRNEINRLVNELRVSKGLQPLVQSDTLIDAAQLQADHQAKIGQVTHDQKHATTATPAQRVEKSKGKDFIGVGENCISAIGPYPAKKKELLAIAQDMFQRWKDSPGHYQNMINSEFTHEGLAFSYHSRFEKIYATQVFGTRGISIEGQLSENAFGITPAPENCDLKYRGFDNVVANMGNAFSIEGDEVVMYYHNINHWNKIFPEPNDGLAVDILFRDQFDCHEPNSLDASQVHDGILLKPVYRDELLENNRALSDYRLITPIGKIPEEHLGKDMQVSLLLINEGKMCRYLVPAEVPNKKYELRPVEPFVDSIANHLFSSSGVIRSQELIYDFERGRAIPVDYPQIQKGNGSIYSVGITCYTSIEGDTIINNKLHNNRAKTILKHLKREISFNDSVLDITAKENWDKMYYQCQYFFADSLLTWPKDSLRKLVRQEHATIPWDQLLFEQRKSVAIINHGGVLSDSAARGDYLTMNLKTAIVNQNWNKANQAMFELYYDTALTIFDKAFTILNPFVYDAIQTHPQLVKNAAAIMPLTLFWGPTPATEFINTWLNRKSELSEEALSNILHLYTLTCAELLDRWDVPSSRLANVIHPLKVNEAATGKLSEELVLNLHLSYIQYYGQINDGPGISKSFDFISNYFRKHSLSQEDDVDLCLFFNSWSRYDLTTNYLSDKFDKDEINEDGVFLLLKTWYFYRDRDTDTYREIHDKALELNPDRYCQYIYFNFQNLRDTHIKNAYCNTCK